ncbi:Ima1 N-terminal domain-containing protein [Dichotomopilus funicola]|uniref:Ima1 N-terminal domain-containing protein n=1 Tax=Dichotomopilus funicola TaxID=1934379 RepID=A0AAN6ZKY3_9PEZI|nr:Ima1 N-terminal domain-containing protein [Dichotomopilus funicola]
MPRLSRKRCLTCFYCGRKNATVYDGQIRRFECPFCDATNYLDQNGDITDPPVATEKEATPRQYAMSRAVSPPLSPPGHNNPHNLHQNPNQKQTTFCATCLKNQHLLSASLAQYLPDPDDPDYAERERGLYRFRRRQEKLYPQICADCEPWVRQRLAQAQYTAKADVLRRMLDRSAIARRNGATRRGWLERVDSVGKWLWMAGFVLQVLWHVAVVHDRLARYLAWAGVDEGLFTVRLLKVCGPVVRRLPAEEERLLKWSLWASGFGCWWNPRFAQIVRGFTRHISGVSKWYFFQALAVLLRFCLQSMDWDTLDPLGLNRLLAVHGVTFVFALLIFTSAPRAIKINMAPLFSATEKPPSLHANENADDSDTADPAPGSATRALDETRAIAALLDEISRSPTNTTPPSPVLDASPSIPRRISNFLPMGHTHTQAAQALTANLQQIDHLHLRGPADSDSNYTPPRYARNHPPSSPPPYTAAAEEMDWSPTPTTSFVASSPIRPPRTITNWGNTRPSAHQQPDHPQQNQDMSMTSTHRAFATRGQRTTQPFGSAPIEERPGPFWYRVPPAPTTPAQRVFNPPNQPRLRARGSGVSPPGADTEAATRRNFFGGGNGNGRTNGRIRGGELVPVSSNDDHDGHGEDYDTPMTTHFTNSQTQTQYQHPQQQQNNYQEVAFPEPRLFAANLLNHNTHNTQHSPGNGTRNGTGNGHGQSPRRDQQQRWNDPRNELSGLFGSAFQLGDREAAERPTTSNSKAGGSWWGRIVGGGAGGSSNGDGGDEADGRRADGFDAGDDGVDSGAVVRVGGSFGAGTSVGAGATAGEKRRVMTRRRRV